MASDTSARQRKGASGKGDVSDDASDLLDSQEQQELINSMERSQGRSILSWQVLFTILALFLTTVYVHAGIQHWREPWGLRHQAELRGEVTSSAVLWAEAIATVSVVLSLAAVWTSEPGRNQPLVLVSLALGLYLFSFWMPPILKVSGTSRWFLLWRPLAPPVVARVAWYICNSAAELRTELEKLKGLRYNCKKV